MQQIHSQYYSTLSCVVNTNTSDIQVQPWCIFHKQTTYPQQIYDRYFAIYTMVYFLSIEVPVRSKCTVMYMCARDVDLSIGFWNCSYSVVLFWNCSYSVVLFWNCSYSVVLFWNCSYSVVLFWNCSYSVVLFGFCFSFYVLVYLY